MHVQEITTACRKQAISFPKLLVPRMDPATRFICQSKSCQLLNDCKNKLQAYANSNSRHDTTVSAPVKNDRVHRKQLSSFHLPIVGLPTLTTTQRPFICITSSQFSLLVVCKGNATRLVSPLRESGTHVPYEMYSVACHPAEVKFPTRPNPSRSWYSI